MSRRIFEIDIGDHKTVCCAIGRGAEPCFIMGPGSFYVQALVSATDLGEHFTFLTSDEHWTQSDSKPIESRISTQDLITFNHSVIQQLLKKFQINKIGIIGFSLPASLCTAYALTHHDHVAWMQLMGISFETNDLTFSNSDKLFKEQASAPRIKKYNDDQAVLQSIEQGKDNSGLYFNTDDYITNANNIRSLKPNASWILETISSYHKAFFQDKERYHQVLFQHWEKNILGQYINQSFRKHFFEQLLPTMDTLFSLKTLKHTNIPIQVFHGEEDYITPISQDILSKLRGMHHLTLTNYQDCGHYAHIENPHQFTSDFLKFTTSQGYHDKGK